MLESLMDAFLDTLHVIPFLIITFLILELIEHKSKKKTKINLTKSKRFGPIVGGLLGALPQCGFSAVAANLFSSRVITMGTVVAIFLSTSDEMLPIMLSENVNILSILKIIGFKVLIGIIVGIVVDIFIKHKKEKVHDHIHDMCEHDHCSCKEDGILLSSIKHSLKILLFIFMANVIINVIIFYVGEDNLTHILLHKNIFTYFLASLIGLIPNCASSVIITELYLSKLITVGHLMAGLLPGSGLGILLLFKSNKDMKENILVLSIIYFTGVILGILVDMVI